MQGVTARGSHSPPHGGILARIVVARAAHASESRDVGHIVRKGDPDERGEAPALAETTGGNGTGIWGCPEPS